MISETVKLWENGAITLPKAWRNKYATKNFLIKETEEGHLEIVPIVDVDYYENKDGSFGLKFPTGIEAKKLARRLS